MRNECIGHAASYIAALLVYAALDDKIRAGSARMTARRDVYDKGFSDGYNRASTERHASPIRPVPSPRQS